MNLIRRTLMNVFLLSMPTVCFAQDTAAPNWLGSILSKLPIDVVLLFGGILLVLKGTIEILKSFADRTETDIDNKILKILGKVARVIQIGYDWIMNNSRPKKS